MAMEGTVQTIEISAAPDVVMGIAIDLEAYPQWVTGVKSVEVLERDADDRPAKASFVADAMIKEIAYTLLYNYDLEDGFSWSAEPGADINAMDGSYAFRAIDGGATEVVYALRVDPAFKVPGFLRRQAEKTIVGTALRGLKRRVEDA
jgi:uncharacterized membrane protein